MWKLYNGKGNKGLSFESKTPTSVSSYGQEDNAHILGQAPSGQQGIEGV